VTQIRHFVVKIQHIKDWRFDQNYYATP